MISPSRLRLGVVRPLPEDASGEQFGITAINSGSVIRIDAVTAIGGFSSEFWLDYLDHWMFHQFAIRGWSVCIVPTVLDHDLSISDYNRNMTPDRYRNIVRAESLFMKDQTLFARLLYRLRLAMRMLRQMIRLKDMSIALITARELVATRPAKAGR
jgi:hypothetical protein